MTWGCICLDLDNTLIDYEAAFKKGMYHTFHHFFNGSWNNLKIIDAEEWFPIFKKNCNELFDGIKQKKWTKQEYQQLRLIRSLQHFDIEVSDEMAAEFQSYFYSVVHFFVEPFADVTLLLDKLEERKIPFGLITNGKTFVQLNKLKTLKFEKWFTSNNVFISQDYGVAKPQAEFFDIAHQCLNRTETAPSLYIGDSWDLDVVGAIDAGWDAIYFNTFDRAPTTNHQPFQTCKTIKDVVTIVANAI